MEPDDDRWQMIQDRDDGDFLYGVRTTRIYCRPTCPSRRPKRSNVQIYDTAAEAEAAGFRACKRCQPDGPAPEQRRADLVAAACRLIEDSHEAPNLAEIAAAVGMSPFHFHRVFRAATGLTPKAYGDAHRRGRLRQHLEDGGSVTDAIYDSGFGSSSRFYARATETLGMKPTAYRHGGAGETIHFAVGQSALGAILVAATDVGICAIDIGDDPDQLTRDLQDRFPRSEIVGGDKHFETLVAAVVALVERPTETVDLPLDIRGTAFQRRVWQALTAIPPGATATYQEIASRIGSPNGARAVAAACAANTLAVAIPCHRVVRTDGNLSGYRWGIERKRDLLEREHAT